MATLYADRDGRDGLLNEKTVEGFIERMAIGFVITIASLIALLILGTAPGRFFLFGIATLVVVFYSLGWVGELAKEAYEEYTE